MAKPQPSSHSREYGPLRLWRDDLAKICGACEARQLKIAFLADEMRFDNIDELIRHFGEQAILHELKMEAQSTSADRFTSATLDLDRMNASLFVSGGNIGSGVFFDVNNILNSRQLRWPFFYSQKFNLIMMLIQATPFAVKFIFNSNVLTASPVYGSFSILLVLWMLWSLYTNLRRHSAVMLIRRSDSPTFWRRNKDQFLIAAIAAILGALIGIVGTKVADRYWPQPEGTTLTNPAPSEQPNH